MITLTLAREGATVIAVYRRNDDAAKSLQEVIRDTDLSVVTIKSDVTDPAAVRKLREYLDEAQLSVDIIVNNARLRFPHRRVLDSEWSDYEEQLGISLRAPFNLVKEFVPAMRDRKWGRIINILSTATMTYPPGYSPYISGKQALNGFSISLAVELGEFGITVNMVSPGKIPKLEAEQDRAWLAEHLPLRRVGIPEDVANAALYFASDLSSFVTGTCLVVDGGALKIQGIR
jgi:3-oxoacyl-[acyl-carrier protein] reductase